MDILLLFLALFGHAVLWIGLVNRLHGTSLTRSLVRFLSGLCLAAVTLIPVGFAIGFFQSGFGPISWFALPGIIVAYVVLCWVLGVVILVRWIWSRLTHRPAEVIQSDRSRRFRPTRKSDPESPSSEDHMHHFLARLPGNQILQIDCTERFLEVPRLAPALDRLSIVHMSDLHFTGKVGKAFFQEVMHLSNERQPDLVAISGDLVDTDECIDWIPDVLGLLKARHGVYFVLGNHDLRVDTKRLRRTLAEAGLTDLGGRWIQREINGATVVLAGNELPWFPPAADMQGSPPRDDGQNPLRILLSHSPDQLDWAVAGDFDLMLAGHLHGGQIRLPWIGPILAPSSRGVFYASSGTHYQEPTILHVSRGLSGEVPVRLNCPPELTQLVLCTPKSNV